MGEIILAKYSDRVELKRLAFGNVHGTDKGLIVRDTILAERLAIHDSDWPTDNYFKYSFNALTRVQLDAFLDFYETYAGQKIWVWDLDEEWRYGLITDPKIEDITLQDTCTYGIQFDFLQVPDEYIDDPIPPDPGDPGDPDQYLYFSAERTSIPGESDGLAYMSTYDFINDSWSTDYTHLTSASFDNIYKGGYCDLKGKMYHWGGDTANWDTPNCFQYTPDASGGSWITSSNQPASKYLDYTTSDPYYWAYMIATARADNYMYSITGVTYTYYGVPGSFDYDYYKTSFKTNGYTWVEINPIPYPYRFGGMASIDDRYLEYVGGQFRSVGSWFETNAVREFDVNLQTWSGKTPREIQCTYGRGYEASSSSMYYHSDDYTGTMVKLFSRGGPGTWTEWCDLSSAEDIFALTQAADGKFYFLRGYGGVVPNMQMSGTTITNLSALGSGWESTENCWAATL